MRTALIAVGASLVLGALVGDAVAQQRRRASAQAPVDSLEVLAWVGGKPVTRRALEERLDQLGPQVRQQFQTAEGRRQILERFVEELVWLHGAEAAKLEERPEIRTRLEGLRRDVLVRTYVQEAMQGAPAPSDSLVEAYYEAHKHEPEYQSREQIVVRHIQLKSEKDARRVLGRLERGESFDELAKRLSQDAATKDAGGALGTVERGGAFASLGRQVALAESAFAAPVGEPRGPVRSSVGWHVLRVDERTPPSALPLESVRPRILATLSREVQEAWYREQLEAAERDADRRWNRSAVDSFLYGRKSAADLFREAQEAPTADARIAGYRSVVEQYPESEFAPQAQFMIGFVYSEEKNDYDSAERAFRELIERYPKSELTESAHWMLENMRSETVPEFRLPGEDTGSTTSASDEP